jgi:nitroreductase
MDLDKIIQARRSIRKFKSDKPDWRETIECIDSMRYAPMAGNNFSLKIILVDEEDKIKKMAEAAQQPFITQAKYITGVAGADAVTVALIQAWKRRAITAQKASDEMIEAHRAATLLWSRSTKPLIRVDIARHMKGLRQNNCIEVPELDINKDCKKLVTELKKLNVLLRDVQRGKKTMLDCYKKAQTINILKPGGKDSVLEILMK